MEVTSHVTSMLIDTHSGGDWIRITQERMIQFELPARLSESPGYDLGTVYGILMEIAPSHNWIKMIENDQGGVWNMWGWCWR